uniref:Uncharacterized protein n=1 Tax=Arundo donax TaxID=35708 RepID=A0A0A9B3H8_ARUDO
MVGYLTAWSKTIGCRALNRTRNRERGS